MQKHAWVRASVLMVSTKLMRDLNIAKGSYQQAASAANGVKSNTAAWLRF